MLWKALRKPVVLGVLSAFILLALLHFKPWQRDGAGAGMELLVGYLPVTCHLTCPVTDFASRTSQIAYFKSQQFKDFPTVIESIKSGRIEATFMIVPLALKLREQGVPVKIVYLGHRDGSTVMVGKNNPARNLQDLRGKVFAIPSKYSNQFLVIRRLMEEQGVREGEIKFVELPPPDMPGALSAGAIDAYFVGEPHAAKSEFSGVGRVLYHAHDIWPGFISCGLVVHEKLIKERPVLVAELVRGIAESGEWAEHNREDAAKVVSPYYQQDEKLLRFVLTQPKRVSYVNLTPTDAELQRIHDMALKYGIIETAVPMTELVDRRFIPDEIRSIRINTEQAYKVSANDKER
jgi:NitT/TauT family transport system substrate-binding protein